MDPDTQPEEPPVAQTLVLWNKVQRWLGDMPFNEFPESKPDAVTTQPMMNEDIVDLVRTENDAPQDESEDEEDIASVSMIKNTTEFLGCLSLHLNHLIAQRMSATYCSIWDTSHWNFYVKFGLKTA